MDYANQKHELSNKHSKINATQIFYKENGEPDTTAYIKFVLSSTLKSLYFYFYVDHLIYLAPWDMLMSFHEVYIYSSIPKAQLNWA